MEAWNKAAKAIATSLSLGQPPVGVLLGTSAPVGVNSFDGTVPAGCSFWQIGQRETIATKTADHENCSIGVHTHALSGASESVGKDLGEVLKTMAALTYVREQDVARIPVMNRESSSVVYGPAETMAVEPEVVLLLANGAAGLIIAEALEQVDGDPPRALGRPACALVPAVLNSGVGAASLGCCGARAYVDSMTDEIALWGLPASKLNEYAERIVALANANRKLTSYHKQRRERLS